MKCHFCNWDNPEGRTKCEKCDHELLPDATEPSSHVHERPTTRKPADSPASNLKRTINENEFRRQRERMNETVSEEENMCPKCQSSKRELFKIFSRMSIWLFLIDSASLSFSSADLILL